MKRKPSRRLHKSRRRAAPRRGSTLMIVIVLLGMLAVLGFLFYTFAAQERSNSEYYANAGKVIDDPGLSADALMDHALQQLIVGTDPRMKNSALWGSRHSMLGNTFGVQNHRITDLSAYNGPGINVAFDGSGNVIVDQNRDGSSAGENSNFLALNVSPAANNLDDQFANNFPQPDVGYTYPDINTPFLAYLGWTRDRTSGNVRTVLIPSFHRPQLNRNTGAAPIPLWEDFNYNGTLDGGEDRNGNGTLDQGTVGNAGNRSLRAHPGHVYVPATQQGNAAPVSRYISTAADAQALLGDGKRVFPFLPMYDGYNPSASGSTVNLNRPDNRWIGHQGVWDGPHPTDTNLTNTANASLYYQLDVDNDGDGVRDGVWLDLEHPVQELADGTLVIPMFSITAYDLSALFDLNSHGNIQNLLFANKYDTSTSSWIRMPFYNTSSAQFGQYAGTRNFISSSSLGVHAGEVNPGWGFTARPGLESGGTFSTVFQQYQLFFGNAPVDSSTLGAAQQTSPLAWFETANMDLAFLKMGRPQVNSGSGAITDLHPGLYGEEHRIAEKFTSGGNNIFDFPRPGQTNVDDNGDVNDGIRYASRQVGSTWLDVNQPVDLAGIGTITASGTLKSFDQSPTTGAVRWNRYANYANSTNQAAVTWGNTGVQSGNLLANRQDYGLFDDPSEVALYAKDRRDVDDPFSGADAAYLGMSRNDLLNSGLTSRLKDLALFSFSTDNSVNSRAEEIRKRFTTVSNDRKNHSMPRAANTTSGRDWEWTDDQGQLASSGTTQPLRFPPTFGAAGSVIRRYAANDPLRGPVRYLLESTANDARATVYQQRLSINKLLVLQNRQLQYRELTQHPTDPGTTPIPNQNFPYPPSDAIGQEYWARKDRQQLARDIYVLLYLLGSGQNTVPTTSTAYSPTTLYTDKQLEQMARFAVNMVDAQDADNVMTRFEYDIDLSNGWNVDDNPYDTSDSTTDRREVWGVERQELALSEVMAFRSTAVPGGDHPATEHDDTNEHTWAAIELRNLAPYDVAFSDREEWQIVLAQVEQGDATYDSAIHPGLTRYLTPKSGAPTVAAGETLAIVTADSTIGTTQRGVFKCEPTWTAGAGPNWTMPPASTFIAPYGPITGINLFDLIEAGGATPSSAFRITDAAASPQDLTATRGSFVYSTSAGSSIFAAPGGSMTGQVRFILRRRAHPTRSRPTSTIEEADNPWVEVDRLEQTDVRTFALTSNSDSAVATRLEALISRERRDGIDRTSQYDALASGTYYYNTFGRDNNTTASPMRVQKHFDRPFTSVGDLLHVPVVGPPPYRTTATDPARRDGFTSYGALVDYAPFLNSATVRGQFASSGTYPNMPSDSTYFDEYPKSAAGYFLLPNFTDGVNTDASIPEAVRDNKWYRILEILEVPTRSGKSVGVASEFNTPRVPGRMNWNTMRYTENFAGLIDELNLLNMNLTTTNEPTLMDVTDTVVPRDWFVQLQNSRDAADPYWTTQTPSEELHLPGTVGSKPFRSLGYYEHGNTSLEHTILRSLPLDSASTDSQRRLLEVATLTEHQNATVDPYLRHRVLSKVWGNSAVRGNTFIVFISAKLFRVGVDGNNNYRIGGPYKEYDAVNEPSPELPEYRGVFIVDRSLLEQGYQAGGGGFDSFRPFVTYRRILREP